MTLAMPPANPLAPQMLSKHFSLRELCRSQTAIRRGIDNTPPVHLTDNLRRLATDVLEPVRDAFETPFSPSSGYRCRELNSLIGGSANSQHCEGEAVDLELPGLSNLALAVWIRDNLVFDQLILEYHTPGDPQSGWVHVSLKGETTANRGAVLTFSEGFLIDGLPFEKEV